MISLVYPVFPSDLEDVHFFNIRIGDVIKCTWPQENNDWDYRIVGHLLLGDPKRKEAAFIAIWFKEKGGDSGGAAIDYRNIVKGEVTIQRVKDKESLMKFYERFCKISLADNYKY